MKSLVFAIPMKDPEFSKTRLSHALPDIKREKLALTLFENTLTFFHTTYPNISLVTVTASETIKKIARAMNSLIIDEPLVNGLNNAATLTSIWAKKNGFKSLLLIPADIPVLQKNEMDAILCARDSYEVVIVESENGGTNSLIVTPPDGISFCYGKNSAQAHQEIAENNRLSCCRFCLKHLSQDIDTISNFLSLKASNYLSI